MHPDKTPRAYCAETLAGRRYRRQTLGVSDGGTGIQARPVGAPAIRAAAAVASIARETTRAGNRDLADEAGERALRLIAATMWALASGGTGQSNAPALKIANRIERTITR